MKMRSFISALAVLAATTGAAYASCDVRQIYKNEQATCAAVCEDQFIRDKQNLELNASKAVADKKACDAKCGCAENSK